MLEQVIYTRCSPSRSLENGQVLRKEGLGFYSISEGLCENIPDRIKLDRLIRKQNCTKSRSAGYVKSYSCLKLDNGAVALTYEVPRENTDEKRYNGNFIRTGNYIKQTLLGVPEDYPYKWFGSSVWNAHTLPQQEYYHDLDPNRDPPMLEQQETVCTDGTVTEGMISIFLAGGRTELFRRILWFLLGEFKKPESERKVLLIRDLPENVELWVAAVERCLSVELSLRVTFDTNLGGLTQNNANTELFYYVNEKTRAVCSYDSRLSELKKVPYAMIAGIHPKDVQSINMRKMPISNFEIADGKAMTFTAEPDESMDMLYFEAAAAYDEDIQRFTAEVLPYVRFDDSDWQIPELFDAYRYIFKLDGTTLRSYEGVVQNLRPFFRCGSVKGEELNRTLMDIGLAIFKDNASKDEENGFELLTLCALAAAQIGEQEKVKNELAGRYRKLLAELPRTSKELSRAWGSFRSKSSEAFRYSVLISLFDSDICRGLTDKLSQLDNSTLLDLFEMFYTSAEGSDIIGDEAKSRLLMMMLVNALEDDDVLSKMLTQLSASSELFCCFAERTANHIDEHDKGKKKLWWDALVRFNGGNLVALCELFCHRGGIGIDTVEELLCDYARRMGRFDSSVIAAFDNAMKQLPQRENTGLEFYRSVTDTVRTPEEAVALAHKVRKTDLKLVTQRKLFTYMNKRLFVMDSEMSDLVFKQFAVWGEELKMPSVICEREGLMCTLRDSERLSDIVRAVSKFSSHRFEVPSGYTGSPMQRLVCECAAQYNDTRLYMHFLYLFDMTAPAEHRDVIASFVQTVISENIKSKRIGEVLWGLYGAYTKQPPKIEGYDSANVENTQRLLEAEFVEAVKKYCKSAVTDQVKKSDIPDADRKALLAILNTAVPKQGGLKGLFKRR